MTSISDDIGPKTTTLEKGSITEKDRVLRFIKEGNDYIQNLPEIEKKAFIEPIPKIKISARNNKQV